jgi:hypothetical protein
MKPFESTNADALKTINECRRAGREHSPGHSKGKPAVSSMTTNIGVRFATPLPQEIEIRQRTKPPERKPGPVRLHMHLAAPPKPSINGEL